MSQEHVDRAREHWNATHAAPEVEAHDNIFNHPLLHTYVSLRAFGTLIGQLEAVVVQLKERTRPGDEILSVGCGLCSKERVLAQALPDRRFVGLDIADRTIATARTELAALGIANVTIEQGDFNQLQLDRDRFACVLGLGAIHHIEALEDFWQQCRRGLRRGGCVLAQEYVGPDRFHWTDAQVREGNRVLRDIVPPSHQVHHRTIERLTLEHMLSVDPSEAVRSSAIVATCRASGLDVTAVVGTGCSLLQPVLMHQIGTFEPRNWQHNLVLARLFAEEDRLIEQGVLDHDFAALVAVRRD
jgi:SAM-dependent methyltransferase